MKNDRQSKGKHLCEKCNRLTNWVMITWGNETQPEKFGQDVCVTCDPLENHIRWIDKRTWEERKRWFRYERLKKKVEMRKRLKTEEERIAEAQKKLQEKRYYDLKRDPGECPYEDLH